MVTIQTAKTSGFAAGAFAGIGELIVSAGNWTVDDLGKIAPGVAARYTVPSPYAIQVNGATSALPVPVGTVYSGANQKPTVTVTYNSEMNRNFTTIWEAHYYTARIPAGSYKPTDEFVKAGDYQGKVVLNGLGSTTP
ncbi:hypothetical protein Barb6XT_02677 [Bacteroidales bacterium Barb6XT]|nr:hypothetical protein Barb6XT_02677 [Bacteroidales bacterium Barb6XT]